MGEWRLSRRDRLISARHEVPWVVWTLKRGTRGDLCPEGGYRAQPRVEWREDRERMGWFLPGKGRWDSARFHPRTRHRLEAYATLLSGVSSDLSKCFLREFRAPTATTRRC